MLELKNQQLAQYLNDGFFRVEGYCMTEIFPVIDLLASADINKTGGVMEIGVHHGQFYMLLNSLTSPSDQSYAVDVFENQQLNIDRSGNGSRELFEANLRNVDIHRGQNTCVIQGDSTDTKLELVKNIGPGKLRFISIDGGHTANHTINDLKLANELIANEGVVILDDITHYFWLGVMEGTVKFLQNSPTLVPFAIGQNKLYLSKLSYQDYYYELVRNSGLGTKSQHFFGNNVIAI